jgi:hypothetical protein
MLQLGLGVIVREIEQKDELSTRQHDFVDSSLEEQLGKAESSLEEQLGKAESIKLSQNITTVKVLSSFSYYESIQNFLCDKYTDQNNESYELILSAIDKVDEECTIKYTMPMNKEFYIEYDGENITFITTQISGYAAWSDIKCLKELSIKANNKEIIDKLLLEVHNNDDKDSKLPIHSYVQRTGWSKQSYVRDRSEETLILNEADKNVIFNDIKYFENNEELFKKYGKPYQRNYLFHGKHGTGKTSFVSLIALKTNKSIYILTFDSKMTDEDLFHAVKTIKKRNAILLLEDIDCIFQDRESSNKSLITFSSLLNVLDGIIISYGLIVIATTNYPEKMDIALMRRMNIILKFSIITTEQINGLLKSYNVILDEQTTDKLINICAQKELVPSMLSEFMFRNIDKLNNKNYIKLFKAYLLEIDIIISKNEHQKSMF